MSDPGQRIRVERLLRGDFRVVDLSTLFLYARNRCDGRESVQEVGDFVAHRDERTKGAVTRATREWFTIVRFKFPSEKPRDHFDMGELPAEVPQYVKATLRRLDSKTLGEGTGLGRVEADKLACRIIEKLTRNRNGTFSLSANLSAKEFALLDFLIRSLRTGVAFDDTRLFDDFAATLKSHGLIKKNELADFKRLKSTISLFAVTQMHNSIIQMDDGTRIQLRANGPVRSTIRVEATVPVPHSNGSGDIHIATAIFETTLAPKEFCEPDLLAVSPWERDLEVTSTMRLGHLA